jgi:hypothetical protein
MRTLGLIVALLMTLSMSAAAQATGQRPSSLDPKPSNNYGHPAKSRPDTGQRATGTEDPYLQRYYSHSEGWSYYNLPPDSSARRSGDQ